MSRPLNGWRVLVTRPQERAGGLAEAVAEAGGIPLRFPAIAIEPREPDWRTLAPIERYAAVLFVSPAAVAHGVDALGLGTGVCPPVGAVGRASADALAARGLEPSIEPVGGQDSHGLLAAPQLAEAHVRGARVLIVRGEGGRPALAEGLMARGGGVDYAEVYRRCRPQGLDPAVAAASDIATATSVEGLTNLLALVDEPTRERLRQRPLAVNSDRAAAAARDLGFVGTVEVASEPGDAGLLAAIRRCVGTARDGPSESA